MPCGVVDGALAIHLLLDQLSTMAAAIVGAVVARRRGDLRCVCGGDSCARRFGGGMASTAMCFVAVHLARHDMVWMACAGGGGHGLASLALFRRAAMAGAASLALLLASGGGDGASLDAEFFRKLAGERLLRAFSGFDLSTGKLPQQGHGLIGTALPDENLALANDKGRRYKRSAGPFGRGVEFGWSGATPLV